MTPPPRWRSFLLRSLRPPREIPPRSLREISLRPPREIIRWPRATAPAGKVGSANGRYPPRRGRGRRAACAGDGAPVYRCTPGCRGGGGVCERLRGREGGHGALARSPLPRRADAEAERLRGPR